MESRSGKALRAPGFYFDFYSMLLGFLYFQLTILGTLLAWVPATMASLMLLRQSMRRANVRPAQVARSVVYSNSPLLVFFMVVPLADYWAIRYRDHLVGLVGVCVALATLFWCAVCLVVAYRRYLSFPHATWAVISSQLITLLVMAIIWLQVTALGRP